MGENLLIKSHRYSNPVFRDEFDRIFQKGVRVRIQLPDGVEEREYTGNEYTVVKGKNDKAN
jgi:hypothetical protein